jgi:hypothetical protein
VSDQTKTAPSLGQRIAARAVAAVGWVRGVSLFVKLTFVAGGALLSAAARYLPVATGVQMGLGLGGAAFAFMGATALLFLDTTLAGALKDAADANAELESLKVAHERELAGFRSDSQRIAQRLSETEARDVRSKALRASARTLLDGARTAVGRTDLDVALSDLLDIGLPEMQAAMEFSTAEIWTVSIYRAEGAKAMLRRLATRRSNRMEERAVSREWKSGEGHIGVTFARRYEMVIGDVTDPAIRAMLHTPASKDYPEDRDRYRSVAAVPVILADDAEPWGVVIATSSRTGCFDPAPQSTGWERAETMRLFASIIALTIRTQHMLPS